MLSRRGLVTMTEAELAVLRNPQVSAELERVFAGTAETVEVDSKR
jgi:hypothetical protein